MTALGSLENNHAGAVAHVFGNGPSMLDLPKEFWLRLKGESVILAHNDAIVFMERVPYWFVSDQTTVQRCAPWLKNVVHVLAAQHLKLPVDEARVMRWLPASFDTLLTNKAPGKYVAGLFSGPVACCWIAWRMGCKAAWLYGCDGYAVHDKAKDRYLWHATRGRSQDWIAAERIGRHLSQRVLLHVIDAKTELVMFPKHQRYGCGFFEMDKFMKDKMPIWNANPRSIYAPPYKRSPLV